ncbi:hypothetical protein DPX16_0046 [Anabarilius grahami]|uniref:Uncharacterized protein n=1 Tax=Anabarilius grahami TaxID=495550 RepID=A0A3N0Z5C7_ANAGA|nr:hypothetical protein DPX16_0046 [Anabarilius grahami]
MSSLSVHCRLSWCRALCLFLPGSRITGLSSCALLSGLDYPWSLIPVVALRHPSRHHSARLRLCTPQSLQRLSIWGEVIVQRILSINIVILALGSSVCVHFLTKDENNREQVNDLLQKTDTMIEQNGGGQYSNQMYEDALRFRQEEEEQRQREEEERKQVEKKIQEEIERVRKEAKKKIGAECEAGGSEL